jgi:hypothetical protein
VDYEIFESLEGDGRPLRVEEAAAPGSPGQTRVLGSYSDWSAALHVIARLEADAHLKPRGRRGFALGVRGVGPRRSGSDQ